MGRIAFYIYRIAAYFIDLGIFFAVMFLLGKFGVVGYFLALVIFFLYRFLTTAYLGFTIGMRFFKLKLNNHGLKNCFYREIYRYASEFYNLGYIYAVLDPYGRTLHDVASGTNIVIDKGVNKLKRDWFVKKIGLVLLVIAVIKFGGGFILNKVGLIGLTKVYQSDEYFQSFDGDNLVSLSQDELYMKTLGRKYTVTIEVDKKPALLRISNKLKYTDVYRLNLNKKDIRGEYFYTIPYPIQFICSGKFVNNVDMCALSPDGKLAFVDEKGKIYGETTTSIQSVLTLKCGDIDLDGIDEAVVLGRDGNINIFKYMDGEIKKIFSGKFGEDIVPETFYIDKGTHVFARGDEGSVIYVYNFSNGRFLFQRKIHSKIKGVCIALPTSKGMLVSDVSRNAMTFKFGEIQRFELYNNNFKKICNFGSRPGKRYAYMVKSLEDVTDIDGDGVEEIIVKSVGKDDVMGQGYKIEIYRYNNALLFINKLLTGVKKITG